MTSLLSGLDVLVVPDKGRACAYPDPQLLENIHILWRILQSIVGDWTTAVAPHQRAIDELGKSVDPTHHVQTAWNSLKGEFLKCLFSYVMFFASCDRVYCALYSQLNRANRLLGTGVRHAKPPRRGPYINKVRRVRDVAIAHLPSDKYPHLDAWAGMSWTPLMLSPQADGHYSIERLTFGGFHERHRGEKGESQDMEISGLEEMHGHCMAYLKIFDEACASYLRDLQAAT